MFLYLLVSLLANTILLIIPLIFSQIIDILTASTDISTIFKLVYFFVLANLLSMFFSLISNMIYINLHTNAAFTINQEMISHLQKVPLNKLDSKFSSSYTTQIINSDSNDIVSFVLNLFNSIILETSGLIVSMCILSKINTRILLLFIFLGLIHVIVFIFSKKMLFEKAKNAREAQSIFFSDIHQQLEKITFIKTHSLKKWFSKKLKVSFDTLYKTSFDLHVFKNLSFTFESIITVIASAIMYIMGSLAIVSKTMSIGNLTILSKYFSNITSSFAFFSQISKQYQETKVSHYRLLDILFLETSDSNGIILDSIEKIELRGVTFNYINSTPPLEDIYYLFKAGNIYGISGKNGSGKSTLIKLIIGLYKDDACSNIYYNDLPLTDLNSEMLRYSLISVIEQEPILLSDTIKTNISFDENIDLNKIIYISKMINIHNIKRLLPLKVGEASKNVSGGEKQKITILRELLKSSDLIIADEPTSALDIYSAKTLLEYFSSVKKNKIIIIVSHDKNILNKCDFVLNIEKTFIQS